jgi:hypothetical protein
MRGINIFFLPVFVTFLLMIGCQKDELLTNKGAKLSFSTDTVYFDTVLTTLGSTTQLFKIYNPYDQPIEIQELYIAGGSSSFFRLNVDGTKGNRHTNILIPRKDSLYVFAEVTIDPHDANNPLLIKDSIIFRTNNNLQDVKLIAYGQDVVIFNRQLLKTQTWTNEKPYLIIYGAAIDEDEVLTIEPGTHIFMHNFASLEVRGKLNAIGTLDEPIVFSGDRFDGRYEQSAGQWGAIGIDSTSRGSVLEHVIIKNSIVGIQVGYPKENSHSQVELRNCMITNCAAYGIYAFGADILASNTIIADCAQIAILCLMGGNYDFYHCTISNVSGYYPGYYQGGYKARATPSLFFRNYFDWYDFDEDYRVIEVQPARDLNLNFYNSILFGTLTQEIVYDSIAAVQTNYKFDHCLIKNHKDSLDYANQERFISIILNEDPSFVNDSIVNGDYDFVLADSSKAIDAGDLELVKDVARLEFDYNGNSRIDDGAPDLGAYEYQK